MKSLNVILGVLVLAAATLAAPAMLASILAGAAGLLMLTSVGPMPVVTESAAQIVYQVKMATPPFTVFTLDGGAGVVVFREVNGMLVSRFYKATA